MIKSLNLDKDLLYNLYINQKKSTREIAKILKCNNKSVDRYLHKYKIPVRHPQKKINFRNSLLSDMYIKQGKSSGDIGKIFGCSATTVCEYLHEYNIPIRHSNKKPLNIDKNLLYDLYINKNKSVYQITKISNCSEATIYSRLREWNIPSRSRLPLNLNNCQLYDLRIKQKKSRKELAEFYNCCIGTIDTYLRKYNISSTKERQRIKKRRVKHNQGYILVYIPNHPKRNSSNYVMEHRLVYEAHLNSVSYEMWIKIIEEKDYPADTRFLESWEIVHHKGIKYSVSSMENRSDNRLENLELLPSGIHHTAIGHLLQENKQLKEKIISLKTVIKRLKEVRKRRQLFNLEK